MIFEVNSEYDLGERCSITLGKRLQLRNDLTQNLLVVFMISEGKNQILDSAFTSKRVSSEMNEINEIN